MKTALLVIDVQQGLCEGEHAAFDSSQVIARINQVSRLAREACMLVIFVQHEASNELVLGSAEWQLAQELEIVSTDVCIRKTTPDSFHRTDLKDILEQNAVQDLIICGMHTEFCVDTTTRRALALGYSVVLVADAHTTEDKGHLSASQIIQHHNETLSNISSFGPRVRPVVTADLSALIKS